MGQRLVHAIWRTVAVFILASVVALSSSCSSLTEFLQSDPIADEAGQGIPGGKRVPIPPTVKDLGVND
jgi:hypothetical protein